jgi:hypothetical protein
VALTLIEVGQRWVKTYQCYLGTVTATWQIFILNPVKHRILKKYLRKEFLLHSSHSHAMLKNIGHFSTMEILALYKYVFYQQITQEFYMSIYSKKLLQSSALSFNIKELYM